MYWCTVKQIEDDRALSDRFTLHLLLRLHGGAHRLARPNSSSKAAARVFTKIIEIKVWVKGEDDSFSVRLRVDCDVDGLKRAIKASIPLLCKCGTPSIIMRSNMGDRLAVDSKARATLQVHRICLNYLLKLKVKL